MTGPQVSLLADGRRLHLHHGPIDLIVEACGDENERRAAYRQAAARFETILDELVAELPRLRQPASRRARGFISIIAQRMEYAVVPHAKKFVTPMAAVAGAVADEIMAVLMRGRSLARAYVNNGGDIALHLTPGEMFTLAIAHTDNTSAGCISVGFDDPIRGIATSGWRGRSFSLGIADAVTVLAADAASADAAATIIANAVDLPGHPAVRREPACERDPDSDLGPRLATAGVGPLGPSEVSTALDRGYREAKRLQTNGLIVSAALFLQGTSRVVPRMIPSQRQADAALRSIVMEAMLDGGIRQAALDERAAQPFADWRCDGRTVMLPPQEVEGAAVDRP
ncbi:thiamine biosynthesis protein ApbE [soil metagenome]